MVRLHTTILLIPLFRAIYHIQEWEQLKSSQVCKLSQTWWEIYFLRKCVSTMFDIEEKQIGNHVCFLYVKHHQWLNFIVIFSSPRLSKYLSLMFSFCSNHIFSDDIAAGHFSYLHFNPLSLSSKTKRPFSETLIQLHPLQIGI